ncbi:hypothetical protein PVAP13_2KG464610 [Panicum virgatum]|uniref:X8 domain-containing protein n=1 Tax=Panicum virgatum TaxID=38727 RepID=A0A8T0WDK6_PANVG|nr:hypothetical protein PVAP13_2KG464610 [Panicum virgatum]
MVLARFLAVVLAGAAALPLLLFSCAEAGGEVGVSYGRVASDLPPDQASVVDLLRRNGITKVRIYDADPGVLKSLANTGIRVMVMLPNDNLAQAARDPSYAPWWVRSNVKAYYPATLIDGVAVGNEVFDARPDLNSDLVRAMTNVQSALAQQGLDGAIKVSTPIALDALEVSWPPSKGRFKGEIAERVMKPMLDFLQRTGSYLSVNLFPCLTYMRQPDMNRDFALGNSKAPGYRDDATGLEYHSLLDAQLDATYFAMEKLGFPQLRVRHTEHGCASGGGLRPGHGGRRLEDGDDGGGAAPSVANAQAYINNLMDRVASGRTGTPHRPDADMDVYIFALFNENKKGDGPDDIEAHYGLFYPNMQKVYDFQFPGAAAASWCVANAAVGDARLQAALDYACGHGADCGAIQPGAACFEPNTKLAHASYAFNSYYQRSGRASGACDFAGAAYVVNQAPSGTCSATAASWCVANTAVGDARLQAALDWACGNGADCSAIQPGATCFQPDTKAAHASYAFNSYYQRKGRAAGTCDFAGAASVVYQAPKIGNCVLPSRA